MKALILMLTLSLSFGVFADGKKKEGVVSFGDDEVESIIGDNSPERKAAQKKAEVQANKRLKLDKEMDAKIQAVIDKDKMMTEAGKKRGLKGKVIDGKYYNLIPGTDLEARQKREIQKAEIEQRKRFKVAYSMMGKGRKVIGQSSLAGTGVKSCKNRGTKKKPVYKLVEENVVVGTKKGDKKIIISRCASELDIKVQMLADVAGFGVIAELKKGDNAPEESDLCNYMPGSTTVICPDGTYVKQSGLAVNNQKGRKTEAVPANRSKRKYGEFNADADRQ